MALKILVRAFFRWGINGRGPTSTKGVKQVPEHPRVPPSFVGDLPTGRRIAPIFKTTYAYIAQTLFDVINDYNRGVEREKVEPKKKTLALAVMVDDLDRCSKENVMEMLKATHLLLEQPNAPMIVFLAVDPQLIVAAIAESFEGVSSTVSCVFAWLFYSIIPHAGREHGLIFLSRSLELGPPLTSFNLRQPADEGAAVSRQDYTPSVLHSTNIGGAAAQLPQRPSQW